MLYVHVPFCRSFCTYCDFYSEIPRGGAGSVPSGAQEGDGEAYSGAPECNGSASSGTREGDGSEASGAQEGSGRAHFSAQEGSEGAYSSGCRQGRGAEEAVFRQGRGAEDAQCGAESAMFRKGCSAEDAMFEDYARELLDELEARKDEVSSTLAVDTLYIGGGTPSVLPLSVLGRIIGACARAAGHGDGCVGAARCGVDGGSGGDASHCDVPGCVDGGDCSAGAGDRCGAGAPHGGIPGGDGGSVSGTVGVTDGCGGGAPHCGVPGGDGGSVSGTAGATDGCGGGWFEELTVEVNPEDIVEKGLDYARGLLELGVNRVSMGVQSLDPRVLKWMNRRHSADGARAAFRLLREAGFRNISVDVIFGLGEINGARRGGAASGSGPGGLGSGLGAGSGATESALEDTLREIVSWRPEHISAYQLSIEDGSALARMVEKGLYREAGEDICRRQYDLICSTLAAAGYHHYEISNWALPGHEAVHNSAYWTRAPYVGLGPGAHSLCVSGTGVGGTEISSDHGSQSLCVSASESAGHDTSLASGAVTRHGEHEADLRLASGASARNDVPSACVRGANGASARNEVPEAGIRLASGASARNDVPSACVRGANTRRWNSQSLTAWRTGTTSGQEMLSDREIREERIMLGLRTARGIDPALLGLEASGAENGNQASSAGDNGKDWPLEMTPACPLEMTPEGRLRIPEKDFFISDSLIAGLLPED